MGARVLSGSFAGQSVVVADGSGSFVIPGIGVVTGARVLALPLACGSIALTGEPATLGRSRLFSVDHQTFTLTGEAAGLKEGHKLSAANGSITLTGGTAILTYASAGVYILPTVHGSIVLTGEPVALRRSRIVTFSYGSIALTGKPATLTAVHLGRNLNLMVSPGGFGLFGKSSGGAIGAALSVGGFDLAGGASLCRRAAPLAAGAFALTGEPSTCHLSAYFSSGAVLWTGSASIGRLTGPAAGYGGFTLTGGWMLRRLTVGLERGAVGLQGCASFAGIGSPWGGGVFALTGEPVTLPHGRRLRAAAGAFALTGEPAGHSRGCKLFAGAGDFSLFGGGSGNKVQRLGGDPGVGVIQWKIAGRTIMDWIS